MSEHDHHAESRVSPVTRHVLLWTAFLVLLVVGIFTVVVPELEDEPDEGDAAAAADAGVAETPAP